MSFGITKLSSSGGGAFVPVNTFSTPTTITGTAITAPSNQREIRYVVSSGGNVPMATPQIGAGTIHGQEVVIIGTSNTDTIEFSVGNGLFMNGGCKLRANSSIYFIWNSASNLWHEVNRNDV